MLTLGIVVDWVLKMLSLSCAASKLASVVIAFSILSPPPYRQPHLLHGLEAHYSELEMELLAHYELHEKQFEILQFDVLQFRVLQLEVFQFEVIQFEV
ncbi:hypothetical protein Tco_0182599 [Tanacetum coccineum]